MKMRQKVSEFTDSIRDHMIRNPEKSNGFFSRAHLERIETIRRLRHDLRDMGLVPQREA